MMQKANMVGWAVGPDGYTVQVLDEENQIVDEARMGNNPLSSDAGDTLPVDHPRALSRTALEEYALRTAQEMAEEHGVAPEKIFNDEDQETVLQEEYDEHQAHLGALEP